ncbi:FAD-dependent oxidoreductase [Actinomadura madurae]|nr:FAD-dependent oxidoreductase [Actinomadura madurae]
MVGDPQYRLLVDTSSMKGVTFDRRMNAFAVEAGARLGEVYRALYEGWGVTVPGGVCPEVGVGGHVSGGGYGPLSRRFGLIVDHLYAVEVVVAAGTGRHGRSSPPGSRTTRTATCGGPTPAAGAAGSAS